jgi:hypothetical protein
VIRDLSEDELSRIRGILEAQGEIEGDSPQTRTDGH